MYQISNHARKPINPKEKANILSFLTFFYTRDLFKKGFRRDIEEDDIYEVIPDYKSKTLGDQLEKEYIKDIEIHGEPSTIRLLWKCYGKYYFFLGLLQFIMKMTYVMLLPKVLSKVVSYFTPNTTLTESDAIYYASVLIALTIINCIFSHNYMLLIIELALRIRTAFSSLIYRKTLKLSSASLSNVTLGKIVTLITKDVNSFDTAIIFANDLWISLIELIVVSVMLYSKLGLTTVAGILFFIFVIILQIFIGKYTSSTRMKASKITDERLQLTQETLSAIKIIKMYTWETFFSTKISDARTSEVNLIKRIYYSKAVSLVIGSLVTKIALFILVMTYIWLGNNLTAESVFYISSCLNILRAVVTVSIPIGISQTAELITSLRRMNVILKAEDLPKPKGNSIHKNPLIHFEKVSVTVSNKTILYGIDLKIQSGLNLLTGRIGFGKSSLLKTILEDYPITQGNLIVQGTLSYASEEPWVFPSSIKQNILFGEKFNEERYQNILQICALKWDISTFENGDNTIIGDRGLNLSKGQQARINLARAIYKNSNIYLLDDCLSSLDTNVQDFVFKECIKKFLKDKIVLLVSHNPDHVKQADNVIIMENGTVLSCTTPSELPEEEIERIVGDDEPKDEDIIDNLNIEMIHPTSNGKIKECNENDFAEDSKLLKIIPKYKKTNDNIYREEKKIGKVDFRNYRKYVRFGGGIIVAIMIFLLFIIAQGATGYIEKLVSKWVNFEQNLSDFRSQNLTNTSEYEECFQSRNKSLKIYTIMLFVSTILVLGRAVAHFSFASKTSINLHKSVIISIFNATMEFFDKHYIGNILNRFSKDLTTIDEYLPFIVYECMRLICMILSIIILIASVNYTFLIPAAILLILLIQLRRYYITVGRSLKRLDASTRSPVLGHLNASLEGITTIRAGGVQKILQDEFDHHQDLYTSACHMSQCSVRAFCFILDMLSCLFVTSIVVKLLADGNKSVKAGEVGLATTQSFLFIGILQWAVRQWSELENQMTSVERIVEYSDSKSEDKSGETLKDWPLCGNIIYNNVSLSYRNSKEKVLNNLNFAINSREKIGVVGRTGAGKSSIIATLFRLYHYEGMITIDDVDIKSLSLDCLRSNIAIIPQDPVLFSGNLRINIDPTGKYSDEIVWKALEAVKLKTIIHDLHETITENGSNFSSGQRQLICLARAIISKNKVIILDEATANMDHETDILIHETIQENFVNSTVITIAHKLHSVLNSDKIMVVDQGKIVEFDKPDILLKNIDGMFYKMVKQANLLK